METRNLKNRLLAFLALMVMFAMVGHGFTDPGVPRAPKAVKALLLMDDLYGASVNIEDHQNNIWVRNEEGDIQVHLHWSTF